MQFNYKNKVKQIRKDILDISFAANACHISSSLSCVKTLVELFYIQEIKPEQFLFGKASGCAAYYAILADKEYFSKEKLVYYLRNYPLANVSVPGVIHSVGSVGHALSVATGIALGNRNQQFYVLLSDGDLMEGSTYEAALFIGQHNLINLHVHIDDNKFVACGKTKDILNLENAYIFYKKSITNFYKHNNIKGDGVDFMQGSHHWHYKNLDSLLLKKALKQL
ncbi:MAG: hypothetical protein KJ725_20315 [Gammaproteobacteria bacterium]|nr:hypothetical protein [Gammaproteobacteria bacterium]